MRFEGTGTVRSAVTPAGEYGLRVTRGTVDGSRIELEAGGSAVFFPVPRGHEASELGGLAAPLTGSTVEGSVEPEDVTTSATYTTAGGGDTAYGVLPHQRASLAGDSTCDLGTFPTVYGDLALCRGPGPTWTAPRQEARVGLDLSGLSARERREVATQVRADVAATRDLPADTYFGGKALYRLAQLLDLASRVGADDAAATARDLLAENLRTLGRAGRLRAAQRAVLRLRPGVEGGRRPGPGLRLGDVQRPPLPLRLLPVRRGGARGVRPVGRRTTCGRS